MSTPIKELLVDIEVSPMTGYFWRLNQKWIPPQNIIDTSYMMCWAAKWRGEKQVFSRNAWSDKGYSDSLEGIHSLLDEADVVTHYNGKKFDIPILNREFLLHGMSPPAPFKQLDIMHVVKKNFAFPSYKLDYVAKQFGLEGKTEHSGFKMWVDAMNGDEEAQQDMIRYNKNDVLLLEDVENFLGPWLPTLISKNYGKVACPHCGGDKLTSRGFSYTVTGQYRRYQCGDCHRWSNERTAVLMAGLK